MEDYLIHYGVLGMKWGVRRYQNKNGVLTTKGRSRYSNKDGKIATKKANKLTDEQKLKIKKGLKIGLAVAGTALVAYGAYKIGGDAIRQKRVAGKIAAHRALRALERASEYKTVFKDGSVEGRADEFTPSGSLGKLYDWNSRSTYADGSREVYNFDGRTGKYYRFRY